MAARLNPRHQDAIRDKIKASQIVNALENHIFGKRVIEPSQVTAALGLLKKCVPDLQSTDISGKLEGVFEIKAPWMTEAAKKRGW